MTGKFWNTIKTRLFGKKATAAPDSDFEAIFARIDRFWKEEYPKKSFDEKVLHWLQIIHRGMRSQGEALGDPYSEFSKEGYEKWKLLEPDFDVIFEKVAVLLGSDFDRKEYEQRIKTSFFIRNTDSGRS